MLSVPAIVRTLNQTVIQRHLCRSRLRQP